MALRMSREFPSAEKQLENVSFRLQGGKNKGNTKCREGPYLPRCANDPEKGKIFLESNDFGVVFQKDFLLVFARTKRLHSPADRKTSIVRQLKHLKSTGGHSRWRRRNSMEHGNVGLFTMHFQTLPFFFKSTALKIPFSKREVCVLDAEPSAALIAQPVCCFWAQLHLE